MTTIAPTKIKTTWEIKKIQEMTAKSMSDSMMAAMGVLRKHGEETLKEFQAAQREPMIKYYKGLGIKTPMDLAKAKAELETNMFGSEIEIKGEENKAELKYISCAMWNNMKSCMNEEQQKEAGTCFEACVSSFAKEFGFTGEVKFDGETATITFKK